MQRCDHSSPTRACELMWECSPISKWHCLRGVTISCRRSLVVTCMHCLSSRDGYLEANRLDCFCTECVQCSVCHGMGPYGRRRLNRSTGWKDP